MNYKIDYFPFREAEAILQKRKVINQGIKEDFKKHIELKATQLKPAWQTNGQKDPENFGNTLDGRVSTKYIAGDYPHFLKPNKVHPYRRLEDHHIKNVMEDALERYESELVSAEKTQQRFRDELHQAHNNDLKYFSDQKARRDQLREENRLFLKIQMEETKLRREKELRDFKEVAKTHFGPEEDELTSTFSKIKEDSKKRNAESQLNL